MTSTKLKRWFFLLASLVVLTSATPALAVDPWEFDAGDEFRNLVGEQYLIDQDTRVTYINVVNWALSITGLILLILIITAGYQWLTAAGNTERVESAKKTIQWAIIGIAMVILSAVITRLVLQALLDTALLP